VVIKGTHNLGLVTALRL